MPRKPKATPDETTPEVPTTPESNGTESVAGYFRRIFEENPRLLKRRSNDELYARWLADHPEFTEVPKSVKTGLQNIKSVLRHQKPKKGPRRTETTEPKPVAATVVRPTRPKGVGRSLERLESMIDECLFEARGLDPVGLDHVVNFLREARNAVIRQSGTGD